jgi:hypothetical protein
MESSTYVSSKCKSKQPHSKEFTKDNRQGPRVYIENMYETSYTHPTSKTLNKILISCYALCLLVY